MLRTLVLIILIYTVAPVNAQSARIETLFKNPPVFEFWKIVKRGSDDCELLSVIYWSEIASTKYGIGDPEAALRIVSRCVDEKKEAPRPQLMQALKYLEGKPGSSKALKDFYLKWSSYLESNIPDRRETVRAHGARKQVAEQAMKESEKALELELELGT